MKKLLLFLCGAFSFIVSAQNASTCDQAYSLCGSLGVPFPNTSDGSTANSNIDYGCLTSQPNPAWFYFPVEVSGQIEFVISQTSSTGDFIDVDFICWGPFSSSNACGSSDLNSGTIADCSYSGAATEVLTIPNAVAGEYYILLVTNFNGNPGMITIEETENSTANLGCKGIKLRSFIDANANGSFDDGEIAFPYGDFIYEKNADGVIHEVSDADGIYTIYDENDTNVYDVTYAVAPQYAPYYTVAPATGYTGLYPQTPDVMSYYDFPLTSVGGYYDLEVNLISTSGNPMPGFDYQLKLEYANLSPETISTGVITFEKDYLLTFLSASETGITPTTNGFEYTFTNLQPLETRSIIINLNVATIPDINLSDLLVCTASITTDTVTEVTLDNNFAAVREEVVGSYDPNDIIESRGPLVYIDDFGADDYLYYTIRFQNEGTAPAFNAYIEEALDAQVDPTTFVMISGSHNFSVDRVGNVLQWTMNNIMLPAAQNDEPGSHGYVQFKVKPYPGIVAGDIIPAAADIYFDFNPAITTEIFNTEFATPLKASGFEVTGMYVYPNPVADKVTINSRNTIKGATIYDVSGKIIYNNTSVNALALEVNMVNIAKGTYFLRVQLTDETAHVTKLIKL